MVRKKLMAGVVMLALLAAITGCAADLEQPPEPASIDVEQPSAEANTFAIKGRVIVDAYHYDAAAGSYVRFYHHESSNVIMDIGKDYVEAQLGGTPGASAHWIALSTDTEVTPPATWTKLPGEIVDADGLARAAGTFASTATAGQWEIENTFTVAAGGSYTDVQQTGLHWDGTLGGDDTLFAANHFSPVLLTEGDTLTITWQLTVS